MEYGIAAILLGALVAAIVVRPFAGGGEADVAVDEVEREELQAAKEAKYREIRDARLDFEMGKLAKDDHRAIDRELRAEAIEILKRLDELDERAPVADADVPR